MAVDSEVVLLGIGFIMTYLTMYAKGGKWGRTLASVIFFILGMMVITITAVDAATKTAIGLTTLLIMIYTTTMQFTKK